MLAVIISLGFGNILRKKVKSVLVLLCHMVPALKKRKKERKTFWCRRRRPIYNTVGGVE